jgi:hypothetical protein
MQFGYCSHLSPVTRPFSVRARRNPLRRLSKPAPWPRRSTSAAPSRGERGRPGPNEKEATLCSGEKNVHLHTLSLTPSFLAFLRVRQRYRIEAHACSPVVFLNPAHPTLDAEHSTLDPFPSTGTRDGSPPSRPPWTTPTCCCLRPATRPVRLPPSPPWRRAGISSVHRGVNTIRWRLRRARSERARKRWGLLVCEGRTSEFVGRRRGL